MKSSIMFFFKEGNRDIRIYAWRFFLKRRNKQQREVLDASVAQSFLQARELMQNLICIFIYLYI